MTSLGYSLRRYYVDEFQSRQARGLARGARVLDLGGTKILKRGRFDIGQFDVDVVYANLATRKQPDVQADAAAVPFLDGSFDAVICAELLEHVQEPAGVIREAKRVLKPGGALWICVPFLYQIHADPHDYGRYTDYYWKELLRAEGFDVAVIEKQGAYASVMMDMMRSFVSDGLAGGGLRRVGRALLAPLVIAGKYAAVRCDGWPRARRSAFWNSFTTGFGILAVKPAGQAVAHTMNGRHG
jgi:SAM-dependent methyltransferase